MTGLFVGLVCFALHVAVSLVWLRLPGGLSPVARHAISALATHVVGVVTAGWLGVAFAYWPAAAVSGFCAVCWLFAYSAVYKSVSLRILAELERSPDRALPLETITDEYVRPEFESRVVVLVRMGCAEDVEDGYAITSKGNRYRPPHRARAADIRDQREWAVQRVRSAHHLLDDARLLDAGQPLIEPLVAVGEALVVDAEQVQHRGVEVADVDRVLDDVVAEVVGLAVDRAALRAAAGHPHREAARVVVAAVVRLRQPALAVDRPAELAAPDDERASKQALALQVLNQAAARLIDVAALVGHPAGEVAVVVPVVVVDLHEADAALDQPPGHERGVGERAGLLARPGRTVSSTLSGSLREVGRVPARSPACGTPSRTAAMRVCVSGSPTSSAVDAR